MTRQHKSPNINFTNWHCSCKNPSHESGAVKPAGLQVWCAAGRFQEKINAGRHKQSQSPGSAPGNPSSAPPRTPTLQFLPDSSISHKTQRGLGENEVIHFHSRCTAQGWGGDKAGGEIMKWEQRKQHRERPLRWSQNRKTYTKPKKINSKWDWEWIVFALNQSHQTTIPNWKPTQPVTVLVVSHSVVNSTQN